MAQAMPYKMAPAKNTQEYQRMDKRERSEVFEVGRGTTIERFSGKSAVGDSTGFKDPRARAGNYPDGV
ncbi:hypothetical protein METHPM2_230051 [Pseudomonas sp. PM2]